MSTLFSRVKSIKEHICSGFNYASRFRQKTFLTFVFLGTKFESVF